jgi:hypothetical protein
MGAKIRPNIKLGFVKTRNNANSDKTEHLFCRETKSDKTRTNSRSEQSHVLSSFVCFKTEQATVAMGQGLSIPMPLEEVRNDYGFSSEDDHGIFREDHRSYEARHDALAEVISNNVKMVLESCEAAGETLEVSEPPAPKKSRKAKYVCTYVDDDGVRRRLHPKMTQWYNIYIDGYLNWPTTVPPMKVTVDRAEIRFSAWLESMRKDVECTFGILKGRWRILKTGIKLQGVISADEIWKTCCALHNWLLEIDGLDEHWEDGVPSEWQGELGEHYDEPEPIRRLHAPVAARHYDLSGLGAGSDREADQQDGDGLRRQFRQPEFPVVEREEIIRVRDLSLHHFRAKLVQHFDMAYRRHLVRWPKRSGLAEPMNLY